MKTAWYKHNLMISSSVGSGHPGKYSYETPHEYLQGWGNLLGKIISVNRNHWSNLVSFFSQITIFLLAYVATFSGQLYFGRSYFFTLFQSNYFDTTVTFSGKLFFITAAFFSFFRTVTFSQELFFQNSFFFGAKLLQSSHFLRIGSSLRQLLFGTAIFSGGTV